MRQIKRLKRNVGISGAALIAYEAVYQRVVGHSIDHDGHVHSIKELQEYAAYMLGTHDNDFTPPEWLIELRQRHDNKINAAVVAGAFISASIDLMLEQGFTFDVALTAKERDANKVRGNKKIS